ncbi:MAG: ABC transporter ATP-binding protein [Eubacteriaceae bacterium]|nr:ABC transporter ATP-binding protein [Eubacteriaceae bacterium]
MLDINGVYKIFFPGTVNEKIVLRNVCLKLNEGDFATLIGSNGAGKSTLLNCIAGVYTADKGCIKIDGVDVTKSEEYKRAYLLGRVFQDPMMGTISNMSIEENIAFAVRRGQKRTLRQGITNKERDSYKELLKILDLGLEDRLNTSAGLLSGGQRQALTFLMATAKQPKLLLLDEHTAALDPATAEKILSLSDKIIKENHLTTLMVTHNMRDAIKHGNRLIMMHEGRIVLDIKGQEKQRLTVEDLLKRFGKASGAEFESDRALLF